MTVHAVAASFRYDDALVWGFHEDPVTAAWDAVRAASLPAGTSVAAEGMPAWWWRGTGLVPDADAEWRITTQAGLLALYDDGPPDTATLHERALARARALDDDAHEALVAATSMKPRPSDQPLGAHVSQARHETVLAARMALGPGTVQSWTTISPGAAPSEFHRLQEAVGPYHVVLVGLADGTRTVGIWTGCDPPTVGATAVPRLHRLTIHQGAWRYGMGFGPGPAPTL